MKVAVVVNPRHSKGYLQVAYETCKQLGRLPGIDLAMVSTEVPLPPIQDWEVRRLFRPVDDLHDRIVIFKAEGSKAHLCPPGLERYIWCAHECSTIPDDWVEKINHMDGALVVSPFLKRAFEKSGVVVPIHVVPNGVDVELFKPEGEPLGLRKQIEEKRGKCFIFMANGFFGPRKGFDTTIKAFCEAFAGDPSVVLYLHSVGLTDGVRRFYGSSVDDWLRELGTEQQMSSLVIDETAYTDAEMSRLYRDVDAFVSFSRGEGFCLPGLEAMASQVPCVLAEAHGHLAFGDRQNSFMVKVKSGVPADHLAVRPLQYHGLKWWEVNHADAVKALREVVSKKKGRAHRARLGYKTARRMTWRDTAESLLRAVTP